MFTYFKKAILFLFISFCLVPVLYAFIMEILEFIIPKKYDLNINNINYASDITNDLHKFYFFIATHILVYYSYLFLIGVLIFYNILVILFKGVSNFKLNFYIKFVLFLILQTITLSLATNGFEDYMRTGNSELKWGLFLLVVSLFFASIPNKWLYIDFKNKYL